MTTVNAIADSMSEQELVDVIVELAQVLHLRVHHCRAARTSSEWCTPIQGTPGFVDFVVAGPGGVVFAELKSSIGKLTRDQLVWVGVLDAFVWRPCDWLSGAVETELRRIARKAAS
jgi:hypothetical protein